MNIEEIFNEISVQMRSDFKKAQKALDHPGLKGDAYEEILRYFLKDYLPKSLDITTGNLIDSNGNISKQLDVIISDASKTPILFQSGHVRVIPVECAYAVIEVKAFLDKQELKRSFENMKSVKSLEKRCYFQREAGPIKHTKAIYGGKWSNWPIHYFIFAYDSHNLNTIKENLELLQGEEETHNRIDSICILDKGVVMNQDKNGQFSALPTPDSVLIPHKSANALLLFYTLSSIFLNQADMEYFNFLPYIGDARL